MKIDKPKEILKKIVTCFPGVKDFDLENRAIKSSNQNLIEVIGFETHTNEKLYLRQPIKIDIFNKYELHLLDLIARLEESLTSTMSLNLSNLYIDPLLIILISLKVFQ